MLHVNDQLLFSYYMSPYNVKNGYKMMHKHDIIMYKQQVSDVSCMTVDIVCMQYT